MNDDLKAYVDGELPPDAAERLRERLEADPDLAMRGEEFRRLSAALRALPEPMSVGQAATLEALARRRPLWRGWTVALAGCAAVLAVVSTLPSRTSFAPTVQTAVYDRTKAPAISEERGAAAEAFSDAARESRSAAPRAPKAAKPDPSADNPPAVRQEAARQPVPLLDADRREAFERSIHDWGGTTEPEDDGLRAVYPESVHGEVLREYGLPGDLRWEADGVRIRFEG